MPMIRMNVSEEGHALMAAAAAKAEMPLSVWMRVKLLEIVRAGDDTKAAPERKHQWLGKPCTKEFEEEMMELKRRRESDINGLPAIDESLNEEMKFDENGDPVVAAPKRRAKK